MQGIHLFTFKGIPVSFQPLFLVLVFILCLNVGDVLTMAAFGLSIFFTILIHEFGHAMVARHYHLHPEIVLCMWGGQTQHALPSKSRHDFFITLAGPLSGLIVAAVLFLLLNVLGLGIYVINVPFIGIFLLYMMSVNFVWSIFNLLPIRPMDGARVLEHLLRSRMKPKKAEDVMSTCSFLFALILLLYFVSRSNMFMICISAYLLMLNVQGFLSVFRRESSDGPKIHRVGLQAEAIYEKGLVAARAHDWRKLEMFGHQMKQHAEDGGQIARAYELMTIACTNLGKYEEALGYAERARQSDAVKQAVARCRSQLG